MTSTQIEQLPRIIQFLSRTDSGEFGGDNCAHCGAKGRYQFHFICEDGKRHAAMAGCIQLYPISPIAKIHSGLMAKQAELSHQKWPNGEQKNLNSWDAAKLEAIEAFYRGEAEEDATIQACRNQDYKRDAWMQKKGFRR